MPNIKTFYEFQIGTAANCRGTSHLSLQLQLQLQLKKHGIALNDQ